MTQLSSLQVLQLYPQHNYTLSSFLESRARQQLDLPFIIGEQGEILSWREFVRLTIALSHHIERLGLRDAAKVMVASANSPIVVALYFALNDQKKIFVPVNPDYTAEECAHVAEHADCEFIFAAPEHAEKFSRIAKASKRKIGFALIDHTLTDNEAGLELRHRAVAEDTGLILYTSGTTGHPKGVMHSQQTAVMAGEAFVERMRLEPTDRLMIILPFFHINALFYSLMGAIGAGASIVITSKFSAANFWHIAAKLHVTEVNIIATIGKILMRRDRSEWRANHEIKKIYGAPVSPEIDRYFREEFHVPLLVEGYGMTEIPGAINNIIGEKHRVGTMGVASRHPDTEREFTQLKVINETEEAQPPETHGELVVKTPLIMQGYYKDPEATEQSFTADGYFKTGDIVYEDSDGYFHFVARKKDIIRRRGENISGVEIDRVVEALPGVKLAATIGVPSQLGEEELLVAVVPTSGTDSLREQDVHTWCKLKLSKLKVPRYVIIVDELPQTPTARVAKHKLKADSTLLSRAVDFEQANT